MTHDELQHVREWAHAKVTSGEEPPWAWYQYMKLQEALDAILRGMASTTCVTLQADSQPAGQHRGSGHLRLVQTAQPDTVPHGQDTVEVPLPM